jgi:serine/alanine adding enzyme
LGTPVYPKRFFAALLQCFAHCTALVVIRSNGVPMAAGFLVFDGHTAEIPWAACREDAKPLGFNMKLYLEALQLSIERGCNRFDFGRTTPGSGTWRFKLQWGAQPVQLHWHRWERKAHSPAKSAASAGPNRLRQLVSQTWSALPLPVANLLGPVISPVLPW